MRWSADQMLAWHLVKQPLKWRDWTEEMHREMPRAQLELKKELGDEKRKAWGIRPGSIEPEQISGKLFRSSAEFAAIVVVDPGGYLAPLDPRDQQAFQEFKDKYNVPEWRDIEFDPVDETKQESPEPPPNSAANDVERMAPAPAADAEDQGGAAAAAAETAGTQPKERRGARPKKRRGTRGPPPETTERVVNEIKDDIRAGHFIMRERHLFDGERRALQKELLAKYGCGTSTLLDALGIVWSELETPTNSDETPTNSDKK
jgi:hypothetical protein